MTKKILFIAAHRLNRSPSQRFRFEQYLDYITQHGYKYKLSYLLTAKEDKIFYGKGKIIQKILLLLKYFIQRFVDFLTLFTYDIVFIQREAYFVGGAFFERLFSITGAKMVFDFDDSIYLPNVSDSNKDFVWLKSPSKTSKIIKLAAMVFAGNNYLQNYALKYNSKVVIIPTTIDTEEYKRPNKTTVNNKICIGWSGSITTIKHFEFAVPFLKEIQNKYGNKVCFKVIGDKNYSMPELNIQGINWNKDDEIIELSEFDIGIMPLPDDEWAKGKCGLKGIQYMALEIPTIMSPVGVNTEIIEDGVNGYLANGVEEWVNKLSLLIDSAELRKEIGQNGRKTVVEKYSVEANKKKYIEYFDQLTKGK